VVVAALGGKVVAWACIIKWSERQAYADTGETPFTLSQNIVGQGVGRQLKAAVIHEARTLGFHSLIARVAEGSREPGY
jgi:phosphinothricin acetyltransferase